ncbi:MAG: AI-2E family transporter [Pseudomonadota bacterium]|nr:AI-2E family transporter [Pseudomonadota bacterium]
MTTRPAGNAPDRRSLMRTAATLSATGLFLLAVIYFFSWARVVVIPFAVAVTIGLTLGPVAARLERHMPPAAAALVMLLALFLGVLGLFMLLAIPAQYWYGRLPDVQYALQDLLFSLKGPFETLKKIGKTVEEAREAVQGEANDTARPLDVSVERFSLVALVFTSVPVMIGQLIMFVGGFAFFLANRDRLRLGLVSLFRRSGHRMVVARIFRDIEHFLFRYLTAISVVNLGFGAATALVMYLLGMPSPQLWGALAALLNFIPYVGPAIVTFILAGVGLITFDPLLAALTPAALFICLNVIESQFVTPQVVGSSVTLNPFLVFLSLAFWAWLWGPIGAFLAVPLLIMAMVAATHLLVHSPRAGPATYGKPLAARANGWLFHRAVPPRA